MSLPPRGVYRGGVRPSALLSGPAGVEDADHVCWAYEDDASFEEAAVRFLQAGLDRGDRLMWVGDGAEDRLRRAGGALAEVDDLRARGVLDVLPVAEAYAPDRSFSPTVQREFYASATRRARDAGFRGLSAVAEVTSVAADDRLSGQFLRWEHLCDDLVADRGGFSVLCAYCTTDVPASVVAGAAAVHPVTSVPGAAPPFQLWVERTERGERIAVAGEIDVVGADRFRRLLEDTQVGTPVLTLDLTRVTFIDLAGARAVAAVGRTVTARGGRLALEGTSRLFRRIWRIIGFADVAEVSFSEPAA